jgi:hypothetical protein
VELTFSVVAKTSPASVVVSKASFCSKSVASGETKVKGNQQQTHMEMDFTAQIMLQQTKHP